MSICKVDIVALPSIYLFLFLVFLCVCFTCDLDMCAPSRYLRCGFDCCKLLCVAVLQWWQGSVSMIVSDIEAAACGSSWLHPAPAPGQEAPGTQPSSAVALVTVLHDCCHALAPTINTTPAPNQTPSARRDPHPTKKSRNLCWVRAGVGGKLAGEWVWCAGRGT